MTIPFWCLVAAKPELSDLFLRVRREPESLDPVDLSRVWNLPRGVFRRFENDFCQYKSGTLDAAA